MIYRMFSIALGIGVRNTFFAPIHRYTARRADTPRHCLLRAHRDTDTPIAALVPCLQRYNDTPRVLDSI